MRQTIILFFLFTTLISVKAISQEIKIKESFIKGIQYSIGDKEYKRLDDDGNELKNLLKGNTETIQSLESYENNLLTSKILGYPGGFLVGWPIGGYLGSGGKWNETYSIMMLVGAPLTIFSLILESKANSNIREAISIYNKSKLGLLDNIHLNLGYYEHSETVLVNINYAL